MDREGFRNRMKQYKEARGQNPQLKYWEWKAQPTEKAIPEYDGGTDFVTYNPYELRRNIQRVLNTTPEGEVNPFYNSLDDTYGSVELPETTVTAPYTRRASLAQQARQGREAYHKAGQKAAPILAAIPLGAGVLGAASVFGFGPTLNMIDVASDPVNPLSYVDKFDLLKAKDVKNWYRKFNRNKNISNWDINNNYYGETYIGTIAEDITERTLSRKGVHQYNEIPFMTTSAKQDINSRYRDAVARNRSSSHAAIDLLNANIKDGIWDFDQVQIEKLKKNIFG